MLGTHDTPLASLCTPAASDGLHALSAAYCRHSAGRRLHQPTAATEVVASNEKHLHSLLTSVGVDHLLCVEPDTAAVADMLAAPSTPPCQGSLACMAADTPDCAEQTAVDTTAVGEQPAVTAEERWQQAAHLASMCWTYRARQLARLRCKVSLVSRGRKAVPGWPLSGACSGAGTSSGGSGGSASLAVELLGSLAQGVSKTLFMEDREACGTCVDLPAETSNPSLSAPQLAWLVQHSGEACCALRGGQLFAERLVRQPSVPRQRLPSLQCQPGMACVVSGGTRGLGMQFAQQLVARGCRALVLTSRSGLLGKQQLAELASQGRLCTR